MTILSYLKYSCFAYASFAEISSNWVSGSVKWETNTYYSASSERRKEKLSEFHMYSLHIHISWSDSERKKVFCFFKFFPIPPPLCDLVFLRSSYFMCEGSNSQMLLPPPPLELVSLQCGGQQLDSVHKYCWVYNSCTAYVNSQSQEVRHSIIIYLRPPSCSVVVAAVLRREKKSLDGWIEPPFCYVASKYVHYNLVFITYSFISILLQLNLQSYLRWFIEICLFHQNLY